MVGGVQSSQPAAASVLGSQVLPAGSQKIGQCTEHEASRAAASARCAVKRSLAQVAQSATSCRTLDSAMVSRTIEPCIARRNEVAVTRIGSACSLGKTSAVALLLPVSANCFRVSACPSAPLRYVRAFPSGRGQRGGAWRGVAVQAANGSCACVRMGGAATAHFPTCQASEEFRVCPASRAYENGWPSYSKCSCAYGLQ